MATQKETEDAIKSIEISMKSCDPRDRPRYELMLKDLRSRLPAPTVTSSGSSTITPIKPIITPRKDDKNYIIITLKPEIMTNQQERESYDQRLRDNWEIFKLTSQNRPQDRNLLEDALKDYQEILNCTMDAEGKKVLSLICKNIQDWLRRPATQPISPNFSGELLKPIISGVRPLIQGQERYVYVTDEKKDKKKSQKELDRQWQNYLNFKGTTSDGDISALKKTIDGFKKISAVFDEESKLYLNQIITLLEDKIKELKYTFKFKFTSTNFNTEPTPKTNFDAIIKYYNLIAYKTFEIDSKTRRAKIFEIDPVTKKARMIDLEFEYVGFIKKDTAKDSSLNRIKEALKAIYTSDRTTMKTAKATLDNEIAISVEKKHPKDFETVPAQDQICIIVFRGDWHFLLENIEAVIP